MKQESEFQVLKCKLIITFADMATFIIFNSFTRSVILQGICRAVKCSARRNKWEEGKF